MNLGSGHQQQTVETKSCGFNLDGVPTQAAVTGPDDIVYVVEQPDSPIEIVSLDLTGTWLSVSGERYTEKICATYKVRNRSDRTIPAFDLGIVVNGAGGPAGSGWGALRRSPLPPGQVVEVKSCGGGGSGGAPGNHVRLVVSVTAVDFGDCFYWPSARIPRSLGITPP